MHIVYMLLFLDLMQVPRNYLWAVIIVFCLFVCLILTVPEAIGWNMEYLILKCPYEIYQKDKY